MGVSARAVKCAAAVVFLAAARARVRKWRRDDLIVNGYFRAVEAVLTALVSRAVSLLREGAITWQSQGVVSLWSRRRGWVRACPSMIRLSWCWAVSSGG